MLKVKSKLSVAIGIILISQAAVAADPDKKGMTLWLDASDSATLYSDKVCTTQTTIGSGVRCWKDKSGKNNHVKLAKNATAASLKLKAQNNFTTVHFSGSATSNTALITDKATQITANSSYTKVVIFSIDNQDGGTGTKGRHNLISSASSQTSFWANNGVLSSKHNGTAGDYLSDTKKLKEKEYHIGITRFSKPDDKKHPNMAIHNILNLNGMRIDSNDDDDGGKNGKAHHKSSRTSIGGAGTDEKGNLYFPLNGNIAEAIVYDRALSNAEITATEKYLAKKWNISLGQSIAFDKPKNQVVKNPAIQLHAISSSGIKVSFTSKTKGICNISKKSPEFVTLDAIGTCKIEANAAKSNDGLYPKASPVIQSFEIKSVKDTTTEAPNQNPPKENNGGGGSPLPLGLTLLGLISLLRRKIR